MNKTNSQSGNTKPITSDQYIRFIRETRQWETDETKARAEKKSEQKQEKSQARC